MGRERRPSSGRGLIPREAVDELLGALVRIWHGPALPDERVTSREIAGHAVGEFMRLVGPDHWSMDPTRKA